MKQGEGGTSPLLPALCLHFVIFTTYHQRHIVGQLLGGSSSLPSTPPNPHLPPSPCFCSHLLEAQGASIWTRHILMAHWFFLRAMSFMHYNELVCLTHGMWFRVIFKAGHKSARNLEPVVRHWDFVLGRFLSLSESLEVSQSLSNSPPFLWQTPFFSPCISHLPTHICW
jgi:hypothetical protein